MAKAPVIAIVGSTCMDLTCYADVLPTPGQTLFGNLFATGFGGKGANQAVMAALAGADVYMVGSIGDDLFGKSYKENFANQKVNSDFVKISDLPTGVAHIWVDKSGENRIIVVSGANHGFDAKHAVDAINSIPELSIVIGQCEIPQAVTTAAFRAAKERGCITILNPAPFEDLSAELLEVTDWLIPNEVEFKQFTGSTPESFNLEKFREGKNSVITVGSAGAILISDSGIITRIPTELVNAVDTTGAGDCFIGSFSYALGCGLDPASAAQFACRIASISVTRKGAQSSYPSAAEISTLS
ncbi:MAG: ribokinase [Actinobacteria bacterium]|nr:ribokinase [Actinomycetota bacterium]